MSTDQIDGPTPEDSSSEASPSAHADAGAEPQAHVPSQDAEDAEATPASTEQDVLGLAQTLLHQPIGTDDRPGRRWAYSLWFQLLVSVFVLYHGVILLVHNLPSKGLAKGIQKMLNEQPKLWPPKDFKLGLHANHYWRATGNTQSWAMFAPNPHRSNIFMKVMVKDQQGEVWDLKHDIYGKRTYPYLWYDRMGKINRRIVDQKGYRRHYAAWVCRQWEKDHEGEPADEIQFVKMWTRIPTPQAVYKRARGNIFAMGYEPMDLHLHQREEETIRCKTTRHAQLPDYLRERYGLPPGPERHFKSLHMRTWWDQKEAKERQSERQRNRATLKRPIDEGGAK